MWSILLAALFEQHSRFQPFLFVLRFPTSANAKIQWSISCIIDIERNTFEELCYSDSSLQSSIFTVLA